MASKGCMTRKLAHIHRCRTSLPQSSLPSSPSCRINRVGSRQTARSCWFKPLVLRTTTGGTSVLEPEQVLFRAREAPPQVRVAGILAEYSRLWLGYRGGRQHQSCVQPKPDRYVACSRVRICRLATRVMHAFVFCVIYCCAVVLS